MTYRANLTREDDMWLVNVEGVGVTQARNLGEAERMAVSLIHGMIDVSNADVELVFGEEPFLEAERLRGKQQEVDRLVSETAAASRKLVGKLVNLGLSGSDIARVLKVSPQRVSQLSAEVAAKTVKAKASVGRAQPTGRKAVKGRRAPERKSASSPKSDRATTTRRQSA